MSRFVQACVMLAAMLCLCSALGCGTKRDRPAAAHGGPPVALRDASHGQSHPRDAGRPDASETTYAWASRVGQPSLPDLGKGVPSKRHEPSTLADLDYASDELIPVRRLVYRVNFLLPQTMRQHRPPIIVPAGEVHIDVGDQRLRARFVGPGWPIDDGSEVRLRADVPGVYVIDGDGGRPLAPGQLANWFQGEPGTRLRGDLRVRRDFGPPNEGPGDLLCALLAEWTQNPREAVMQHCVGTIPPAFRCGLWAAEMTAIVPLTVPRSQLRADAVALPSPLSTSAVRALLETQDLARIAPTPVRVESADAQPDAAVSGSGLSLVNESATRVVVIVQGAPIGWMKPGARGSFEGLTPGYYHIAAMRPAGQLVLPPTLMRVPAQLTFTRPNSPPQLSDPFPGSPPAAR